MTADEQRDRHYASIGGREEITVDSDVAVGADAAVDSDAIVAAEAEAEAAVAERWQVRGAELDDVPAAVAAVAELLTELGGRVPDSEALEAEGRALVEDPAVGILLIALPTDAPDPGPGAPASDFRGPYEALKSDAGVGGGVVGVLAASWGRALHVPGRYLTIQDLWVRREWRSAGVGAGLVHALADRAAAEGVRRLEVGLPRESFEAIGATERFYLGNGFEPLGPRMRRLL